MSKYTPSIKFEIIKEGNRFYAIPTVFVNKDGFPDKSRCNECSKFNRRITLPNDVKVTTGKDGRTYITPKVDNCWQHFPTGKGSKPKGVEWEMYREDYYIHVQHKWKEPVLVSTWKKRVPDMSASAIRKRQMGIDPHPGRLVTKTRYSDYWVRTDLVEQFIANPPFLVKAGELATVSNA